MARNIRIGALLAIVVLTPFLSACNQTKRTVENTIRERLIDPDSVKFYEYYYNDKTEKGCYIVNAKNKMGGYTGKTAFSFFKKKDGTYGVYDSEAGMDFCKEQADKLEESEK